MKARRNWLMSVWSAICLNGAFLLAQEVPAAKPDAGGADIEVTLRVAGDVTVRVDEETKTSDENPAVFIAEIATDQPHRTELAADAIAVLNLAEIPPAQQELQSKYWIGLICNAPDEALRVQLDLPADVGLLVGDVTDGGPAMKAGIQRHDLLLSVAIVNKTETEPRQLKQLSDLVNQIQAAETAPLKIAFLRRGRKQALEVVPEERPKSPPQAIRIVATEDNKLWAYGDDNQILRLMATVPRTTGVGMRWAGPMIVQHAPPPLPNGVSIEYQPAEGPPEKLVVKKGDQTWVVTPAELDKLPDELRASIGQQFAMRRAFISANVADAHNIGGIVAGQSLVVHGRGIVLPADVTVTVVRQGAEPAKVNLKRGDQSWDVTEKDLAKLPEELRPYAEWSLTGQVSSKLARSTLSYRAVPHPTPAAPQVKSAERLDAVRSAEAHWKAIAPIPSPKSDERANPQHYIVNRQVEFSQRDIERQLKELTEQVEKLRQAVEKSQPKH